MMRFVIALVAAIAFVFTLSSNAQSESVRRSHWLTLGQGPSHSSQANFKHYDYVNPYAPKGGTLSMAAVGTFDDTNIFNGSRYSGAVLDLTVDHLMEIAPDDPLTSYCSIAKSVELPANGMWVAFNLRQKAVWHDATPITADDIVFSFNALKKINKYKSYYQNVVRAEIVNRHKVKFYFQSESKELPWIVGQMPILSKTYWGARNLSEKQTGEFTGSGPYRVKSIQMGQSITLERVENYWGKNLPINKGRYNFNTIKVTYYSNNTDSFSAFLNHQYDFRDESILENWSIMDDSKLRESGLKLQSLVHTRNEGMQAYVYNIRIPKFKSIVFRYALGLCLDFQWININLFRGQYKRAASYFSNSEFAAARIPGSTEAALIENFWQKYPRNKIETHDVPPPMRNAWQYTESDDNNTNLRTAQNILLDSGYQLNDDGEFLDPETGKPLSIEILIPAQMGMELPTFTFIRNLRRVGINADMMAVDMGEFRRKQEALDFEMTVYRWSQSESPGHEQLLFWGSASALEKGSENLIGVKDEGVDFLIDKIIASPTRSDLILNTRVLDRVLLMNYFVVPQWYAGFDNIAYWDRFSRPAKQPSHRYDLHSWWIDSKKEASP